MIAASGQSDVRTFLELVPQFPIGEWWQLLILLASIGLILAYVAIAYRADCVELPRGLAALLTTMRILAFLGILIFFLNPEKHSETRIAKSSRVSILVDTSLSMGLSDANKLQGAESRIDQVVAALDSSDVIDRLRDNHEVQVFRFGELNQPEPLVTFAKRGMEVRPEEAVRAENERNQSLLSRSRRIATLAQIGLVVSLVLILIYFGLIWFSRHSQIAAWFLMASLCGLVLSVVGLGVADLNSSQYDFWTSIGWRSPDIESTQPMTLTSQPQERSMEPSPGAKPDWSVELAPTGTATQMGAAIQHVVNRERGGPIAGIVVITDGRNTSGTEPSIAAASATDAGIPVYAIGIGSDQRQKNVAVADIQCPSRVFPGDKFSIKALIQGVGFEQVTVELVSVDEKGTEAEEAEAEKRVTLLPDNRPVPVQFNIQRNDEGKRRFIVRVRPAPGELDTRDNERTELIEIVERKTRILLMAGGPTREFRFLRNQLYRDRDVVLHVWLQTAKAGADQEADKLLFDFPSTREAMFEYDCVIAFDPEWRTLNENQAALLERWVSEKAGGLIVVAGPVYTPEWTRRPRGDRVVDRIRRLYPVSFFSQGSATLKLGRFGGERAYPLEFTREGRVAEQLWLADTATENQAAWARFDGVFGYYAVNEAKQGADILAYFADPSTMVDDQMPIYLASHFYGSGRVFFQASGEMWRIREVDVEYFQQYYTKLVRWASQGRLLRDSNRGVLLVDRPRCWVGDSVAIRALLRDARDEPLTRDEVNALIVSPDGETQQVKLRRIQDVAQPGTYLGEVVARREGDYRISLAIPDSAQAEVISAQVRAAIPDLEKQRPERNDATLSELANRTGGHYFVGLDDAFRGEEHPTSLISLIEPRDQESFLPGIPDRDFTRRLMGWLLGVISLVLVIEWTVRRLHKLA